MSSLTKPLSKLSRTTNLALIKRFSLQYARTRPDLLMLIPRSACVAQGFQSLRHYANGPGGPPGGSGGGFPGLSLGPQHQKGDALKEYVRLNFTPLVLLAIPVIDF